MKLFSICQPNVAVFGEKDYQQLCVIRQLVTDFNLAVDILSGPTVREADGLAMSSRNMYLSPEDRIKAPLFYQILSAMAARIREGEDPLISGTQGYADLYENGFHVDYVQVRDAETLERVKPEITDRPLRLLAAAYLEKTRLIDNIAI